MIVEQEIARLVAQCGSGWLCPFWAWAQFLNLGVVLFGGVIGGLLQPIYARLNPDRTNPPGGDFLWSALLGLAAAGISVYVVANSNTHDPVRLLFFSLLCGLAFPSVLTSAVDSVSKKTQQLQDNVTRAADQARSDDPVETALAADQLKKALASSPLDALGGRGVSGVEANAQIAVQNIAGTASANPESASDVINQLQQVATVAKTMGYEATATTAEEEIKKLIDPPAEEAEGEGEDTQPSGQ
jgi:hypothetical protein